jgi:tetratricopeptide (TPR) repeat protein
MHQTALKLRLAHLGPNHPDCSDSDLAIGCIKLILGKFIESQATFASALDLRKDVYGERHYKVSEVQCAMAEAYRAKVQFADAAEMYDKALAGFTATFGDFHSLVGTVKLGKHIV